MATKLPRTHHAQFAMNNRIYIYQITSQITPQIGIKMYDNKSTNLNNR